MANNPQPRFSRRDENLIGSSSAARFERSIRGAFDRNMTCPVQEADCDVFLGKFRVGSEAKS
ncbi:hypothetical protein N7471_012040 [Penicillium samsonianum]|uniref:uncharacterized protein n=1 Tax=Penicillium samsonianum TaxID=1882272 RepID=UPI00254864BA|nr:uncharacterized protein N7471_012040 [Penicillium samsonianum]KAJ6124723.1 hypothetical protein N7471_012040 [Penicillium samsonianum]